MLVRILRLFAFVRDLELRLQKARDEQSQADSDIRSLQEAVQNLSTEKLILQDRLDAITNDRANLWEMTKEAISNERSTYQQHINVQWQKQGWEKPWPDAPGLTQHAAQQAQPAEESVMPRNLMGSEQAARRTKQFIADYYKVHQ